MNTSTPGTYVIFNPLTYTTQELRVTTEDAEVYAVATGPYPASFLHRVSLDAVVEVLAHPHTVVYSFSPVPVPTIGKARARCLHQLMGRLGLHEHYGLAARALGRDVFSLATLTEQEARRVWAHVVNLFPHARDLAA